MSNELKNEDLIKTLREGVESFTKWAMIMENIITSNRLNLKTIDDLDLSLANLKKGDK